MSKSLESRFWKYVDKQDSDSACWLWTGSKESKGYGQFWSNGKPNKSHRIAWELVNGEIPDGMRICHHCDVRNCVNPSHLFLGTDADNSRDMVAKGRVARGESNSQAKLTATQVTEIRRRHGVGGICTRHLSREYGVSKTTIRDVMSGKYWQVAI